ncbi:MAG TPA: LuxR C-terminal-related transcriptional regulator [Ktedonobacteraceae bacterium]
MPKSSQHALIWSEVHQHYELHTCGQPEQCLHPEDESAWQSWLAGHTSFAFQGQAGRLSVIKEAREGGTGYWYAYRTQDRHTRKRYLGRPAQVTFARLENEARVLKSSPSPAHHAPSPKEHKDEQRVVLLSSRLSHPRLPISLVERGRLLRDLDAVHSHRLTLVSASAGSGKTTLLSAWAAASANRQANGSRAGGLEHALAWLSLEALDDDPIRFWASVITALRTCLPAIGQGAFAMLHSPQSPPLSTILTALLNEICEEGSEIILILDDYHVIEDQAIHEAILFLLDHLPSNLHLVLATRTDPEFPLSQLRVRGQMIEIRDRDLRFTREEAASFLTEGMGLPLSEEDVATLQYRTEGWIAGLQLAALSLRKREDLYAFVKDFAGSHRFVLDYVQQEILARLPVMLQNFLLQTSILTSMNAALCQAVTALPTPQTSQEMLEALERANLFVVPFDEQRQWYRFHDLFREALRTRLHASQPDLVPLLHIRAARWYEAEGELREAIAHALAAPDYAYAASLMEQAAKPFWLRGEARTIHSWVLALPDAVLRSHLRLTLEAALRFLNSVNLSAETPYTSMQVQVERTITRMEGLLRCRQEPALSGDEVALIERRLRLLRALIEARGLLKHGDQERLRHLALEIEALPPDEETSWNMIPLSFTFWLTSLLQQEGALLVPRLLSAKQMMEGGDPLVRIRVRTWLADAYIQAGQLHLARQEGLEALALIEQTGGRTTWSGYLQYSLFTICYARNRLEEAADWLQRSLQGAQDWHQVELLVLGRRAQARLELARGDLQTAQEALHQLEALVEQEGSANHARWVIDTRLHVWLAQGNLAEASAWAAQTMLPPNVSSPVRTEEVLMRVRVLLAQQQYALAVEQLQRWSQHLDRPGDIPTALEWMALSAVALRYADKREQAVRVATRLLALTEPEDSSRVYLDAGEPMKQVLRTLLEASQGDDPDILTTSFSRPYVARLLAVFEQEECKHKKGRDASPAPAYQTLPQPAHSAVPFTLSEPLSQQEQRVLRLLVAGQTYAEMAQAQVVSPNTIKTQVSSIYRKLGVSRRGEAIVVSQRLHLL